MFTSNGIQFQTPFTTALDKGHIPVDPAMRDICTHDKATPETVAMAVKECADRHQALIEEWLKTNTPKVCEPGAIQYSLTMNAFDATKRGKKVSGWLQNQMSRNAVEPSTEDRPWVAHDDVANDFERRGGCSTVDMMDPIVSSEWEPTLALG